MRRPLVALAVAVAVAVVLAALAWRTRGPPADLIWTQVTDVITLDPARMTSLGDGRVAAALFEGLTVLDARDLEPRPGVAERWEVSADGRTWTFHLRAEARWSDGRPVTAGDFSYAWRRALDPKIASEYVYMLWPIRGARAYTEALARGGPADGSSVGVRPEGPRRLLVDLEQPTAYFLSLAAFSTYLPLRRDCVEDAGGKERPRWTFPPNLVSNGAYRAAAWRFGRHMRLEKNEHYWNAAAVALGRIEARVYEEPATALAAYETGEIALVTDVPAMVRPALLEARREGRRRDVVCGHDFATYFYRFNCRKAPLDDGRVRRALALAVDRRAIIERGARGGQAPAAVLVPPGLPGYRSPRGLEEDAAEAKRLLAAAGYGGGRDLPELAILVNKGAGHVPVAEIIQHQWRERLALRTRIEQVEFKVLLDRVRDGRYQIARAGWFGDYLDPNTFLDMFVTDGGNNRTGWSSAAYDALIARAAAEPDPAARMAVLGRAEALLLEEVPIVPIYFYSTMMLARPDLEGLAPNLLNRIDFAGLRWRPGPAAQGDRP